jgi:hypothetical protein
MIMAVINLTGKSIKGLHNVLPQSVEEPLTDLSVLIESTQNLLEEAQAELDAAIEASLRPKRKYVRRKDREPVMKVYRIEDLNVG